MCMLSGNGTGRQQENFKILQENILWNDILNLHVPQRIRWGLIDASSLGTMRLECCRTLFFTFTIYIWYGGGALSASIGARNRCTLAPI